MTAADSADASSSPNLSRLAVVFALYGNSTFGGGTATIVQIEKEVVDSRRWLAAEESRVAYAISRLTPGTNLLAYCTGIGWRMRGLLGAVIAATAASIPCAVLAATLTHLFATWSEHSLTKSLLRYAVAAAIGMLGGTVWTIIRPHMIVPAERGRTLVFIVIALLLGIAGLAPFRVLLVAAMLGAIAAPDGSQT